MVFDEAKEKESVAVGVNGVINETSKLIFECNEREGTYLGESIGCIAFCTIHQY